MVKKYFHFRICIENHQQQKNQLAIHLYITFNSMLILTQQSISSMNKETNIRERYSCLILQ